MIFGVVVLLEFLRDASTVEPVASGSPGKTHMLPTKARATSAAGRAIWLASLVGCGEKSGLPTMKASLTGPAPPHFPRFSSLLFQSQRVNGGRFWRSASAF